MNVPAVRRREWSPVRLRGRPQPRGYAIKAVPGGFPQRRAAEVPWISARDMREVQRIAQEEFGLDILQLMENAGRAAATLALAMLGGRGRGQRVIVLAGGGNKGAAGLCAARNLANWGCIVEPVLGEVEEESSFAARRQLQILRHAGISDHFDRDSSQSTLEEHLRYADLIIDALVGYGRPTPKSGIALACAELAVASRRPILALDVPTGIDATTGEVTHPVVPAVTTLALDLPKQGLLIERARPYVGEIYLADLGIPRKVYERVGIHLGNLYCEGPIVRIRR